MESNPEKKAEESKTTTSEGIKFEPNLQVQ